ncbi:hypothetical protein BD626DRAFT_122559 [Schizophyllum amplum]|uniref:Methyltransferase domain-containing protein n=1 Tax=Schizophyllum amplum TaxID=97359 RepID=A0A550C7Z6_9AGAR|nr:hypothetical protein BD626DRAFT_122559 [Auriculariopsis ampla]
MAGGVHDCISSSILAFTQHAYLCLLLHRYHHHHQLVRDPRTRAQPFMSSRTAAGRRRLQNAQVQTSTPTSFSPRALFGFGSKAKERKRTPKPSPTPYVHNPVLLILRDLHGVLRRTPPPIRPSVHFTPSTDDPPSVPPRHPSTQTPPGRYGDASPLSGSRDLPSSPTRSPSCPTVSSPRSPFPPSSPRASGSTLQPPQRAQSRSPAWQSHALPPQEGASGQARGSHAAQKWPTSEGGAHYTRAHTVVSAVSPIPRRVVSQPYAPPAHPCPPVPRIDTDPSLSERVLHASPARNGLYFAASPSLYSLSPVSSPERTPSEFLSPGPYGEAQTQVPSPASSGHLELTSVKSIASSSSSSHNSTSSNRSTISDFSTTPESPSKFVFPTSRSVAKPGGPSFKFGRKKPSNTRDSLSVTRPPLVRLRSYESAESLVVPGRARASSTSTTMSTGTAVSSATARSASSTGSTATAAPQPFVFPSSRTRANPSAQPALRLTPQLRLPARRGRVVRGGPSIEGRDYSPMEGTLSSSAGNRERVVTATERRARARSIHMRVGEYPFDQRDPSVQERDRHTHDLLRLLKPPDQPCFHDYGQLPPMTVLDLGCGQGWWMLEAARAWQEHGTQVIGFDLVDTTSKMWDEALMEGVSDNMRVNTGNFLTQSLPFEDETFDLVRMANLTYAIPFNQWEQVLREAKRVLTVGGRLELIDDHVFFSYGDTTLLSAAPWTNPEVIPPRPDSPQSPRAASLYLADAGAGHDDGHTLCDDTSEEGMDTATLHGPQSRPSSRASALRTASEEAEALFEYMMSHKFGLNLRLHAFLLDTMHRVFNGRAHEAETMRLAIAGPLASAPGLVLWPSTCIPMRTAEIEKHASRHCRTVLACQSALTEYALEVANEDDVDDDTVAEALWDYSEFLPYRFDGTTSSSKPQRQSVRPKPPTAPPRTDPRASMMSVASDFDALIEYQSEFRDMFDHSPEPVNGPRHSAEHSAYARASTVLDINKIIREENEHDSGSELASRDLTHIRTFRVFDGVKT